MTKTFELEKNKLIRKYKKDIKASISKIHNEYIAVGAFNSGARIKKVQNFILQKIEEFIIDFGKEIKQHFLNTNSPRSPKIFKQIYTDAIKELDQNQLFAKNLKEDQMKEISCLVENYSEEYSFGYIELIKEKFKPLLEFIKGFILSILS